ncbi:hypothetical protein [Streptomyces africanus]|uniref:hypothetical protein n=1 Tax=Streptomyces africanus TaxID=231024 RepID=UPI000A37A3B0|nr:hypothetical protein [Streptomyces africanus]
MESVPSSTAWRIARRWAEGLTRSHAAISSYALEAQDHLDHGADPEYLARVAVWASLEHPGCLSLDLGMRFAGAPRPEIRAQAGHACPCRGGPIRGGGAPAPAIVRQLIRRSPDQRAA